MAAALVSASASRWWRPSPGPQRRRPPSPTSSSFPVTNPGARGGRGLPSSRTSLASSSASLRAPATSARYSWEEDLERVLWTEAEIAARVSELAAEISEDVGGSDAEFAVVGVATGAFIFLADLVRGMGIPVAVDLIRVESYGSRTESNSAPAILSDVKIDVKGKHVILVEDIVDTGHTLSFLVSHMKLKGVCSVSICTFLDKPGRRMVHFELAGNGKFYRGFEEEKPKCLHCGRQRSFIPFKGSFFVYASESCLRCSRSNRSFRCPDCFVVGYGMDFSERYRNMPFVGVLKPEKYAL